MFIKVNVSIFIFLLLGLVSSVYSYAACHCGFGSYCGIVNRNCLCFEISNGLYVTPSSPTAGCNDLVNYCDSSPCENGGTCYPSFGSYYCTCTPGYHGQSCNLYTDPSLGKKFVKNVAVYYDIHEAELYDGLSFMVIIKEKGDGLHIEIDDGNGLLLRTPYILLNYTNPHQLCQGFAKSQPNEINPEVCDWVTNDMSYIIPITLRYPIENKPGKVVSDEDVPMGRMDIATVTVKNGDEVQYSQTYPIFTSTNLEKRKCIMGIELSGGSDSMKEPTIYYRNQDIIIKSATSPLHTRCKFVTYIRYIWYTTGYRPGSFYSQKTRGESFKQYDVKSLLPGVYTVELMVEVVGSPEAGQPKTLHRNQKKCWFELRFMDIIPKLKHGKRRIVQESTKVILDASPSEDPNYDDNSRLRFNWSCNDNQPFCRAVTRRDPIFEIRSMPVGTFEILLNVSHTIPGVPPAFTSQIIEVIKMPVIEDFELMCLKNCENSRVYELTHFQLNGLPPQEKVRWTYTKNHGEELSADVLRQEGTPDDVFIIKENALDRNCSYTIKAQVGNTYNEIELTTVKQPSKGNCEIIPTNGVRGYTSFDISCINFKSYVPNGEPLEYDIYQKVVSKQFSGKFENFLISSSTSPKSTGLQLINQEIIIKVSNSFGDSVTETLSVELSEPAMNKEEINNFVLKVQENIRNGEIEKAISSIFVVADYIDKMYPKAKVINTLIDSLSKIPLLRVLDVEQIAEGLHFLLYQSVHYNLELLTSTSVRTSASILHNMTTYIKSLFDQNSFVDTETVIGLSKSFIGCVNSLIKTRNTYLTDKSKNLEKYKYSYYRYLSASTDLIEAINGYSDMVFNFMVPCQKPIRIEEELIVSELIVDRMNRLVLLPSIDPSNSKSTFIKFDPELSSSYQGKEIEVQVTHFKENWFWWVETELPMHSDHINVVLSVHGGDRISSLDSPVHIYMKTKPSETEPLKGDVMQPDPFLSSEIKDLFVKVFILERSEGGGGGTFLLECPNLSDVELDVLILVDEFPDYDKVRTQGKTLSSKDFVYESKSLADIDPEAMIYLGVLPNPKHSIGETVLFKCQIYDQVCRTWSRGAWDNQYCEIGPESTYDHIQCSCKHLSLFGASLLVPPNQLHPLQDIILLISIKDNPYVMSFVLLLLFIYFSLFIWAWRMDRKDKNERVVRVLVDNFPGETYGYLLAVFTGEKTMSGTTAHVGVKLCGSNGASHAHILNHDKDVLQLAQDNWFLIFTEKYLGGIECLRVWHDNYGASPDWYCNKIIVYDLKTRDKYTFIVEKWLSVYYVEKDWRLEWVLVPVKLGETDWQNLARENFFINLREKHLWISIFVRHPRTAYTRLQRLTVAMLIIMVTMLLAIMFYGAAERASVDDPTYSLTVREIVVVLQCAAITFPITMLVAQLFKWSRPTPKKHKDEKIKRRTMGETVSDFVKSFLLLDPLMPVELYQVEAPQTEKVSRLKKISWFLAWALSFIIIFGCSLYLILYGLKLGPNRSLTWLSITLLNMGQSIFLLQPAKIIAFALLFTFIFKESNRNVMLFSIEYKGVDPALKEDHNYMANLMDLRSKPMYNPLSQFDVMMLAKKRKRIEQQKWRIINFLSVCILFISLWILTSGSDYSVAYYNSEHLSYLIRSPPSISDFDIDEVYNQSRFFDYVVKTLLPSLHTTKWYNGADLPIESEERNLPNTKVRGWTNDFSNKILGVPRLRQLRIIRGTCSVPEVFQSHFEYCNSSFSTAIEDTLAYTISWSPASFDGKEELWFYSTAKMSESVGMYGASGYYYPGGGYIQNLTTNMLDSSEKIIKLKIENWFDELTRAVFIEFNLYNAFSNLFSRVTIITENLASGVIATRVYIDTAYHQFYLETLDIPFLIALIFFIVILILSLMRVVIHVSVQGMGPFLNSCGNFKDVLIIFFGFSCVIAYLIRVSYFKVYSDAYKKTVNEEFISFAYPFYQDDLGSILFSILIVITTNRLLQLAHYGKYYYILRSTFNLSRSYIICSIALILFFTSLLSMVAYITQMQNYRMLYTLIVPKINFLNRQEFSEKNILFKVALNLIYFIGGMFITAVFIVFYAKSKFQFITLGRVGAYTNHFLFLFKNIRREINKILTNEIELRIQQGTATREEKNKYRRKLYDAAKQRVTRDFKLKKWEAEDIMADFVNASVRHTKMCKQLDQIMEYIE